MLDTSKSHDVHIELTCSLPAGVNPTKFTDDMRRRLNVYLSKHAKTNKGMAVSIKETV